MKKLIVLTLVLSLSFFGCAAMKSFLADDAFTSQLATEAATARVLHEHPEWKQTTLNITTAAMTLIDKKTIIDLAGVEAYVKAHVNWDRLTLEEQALASALISTVRANIEDSLRAKDITEPEKQMVEIHAMLGWINATAGRTK
jgi:hypothetical protein